jgi:very-short-patch-repair endonuclease
MKKEKYLNIFKYLLEFSKIRTTPVKDIELQDQRDHLVWFDDIPADPSIDNILSEGFDLNTEYWIKATKPKRPDEPKFPLMKEELQLWIEPDTLVNENEFPKLKETIEVNGQVRELVNFPNVHKEFERYVENSWFNDVTEYNKSLELYNTEYEVYKKLNSFYSNLFSIYNKVQYFGEDFELIVGLGLLNYQPTENRARLFRHVITQQLEIRFNEEKSNSEILIYPDLESKIKIETDFLLDADGLEAENIVGSEKAFEEFIKVKDIVELLPNDILKEGLQMFSERIASEGRFVDTISRPKVLDKTPTVCFSPALILRRRDNKSFSEVYERIIKDIEDSQLDQFEIPLMDDLIGVQNISNGRNKKFDSEILPIYFPKESNEEQREIVEKLRVNKKVLVQGPPGTGKSHTIANLICHLLANGNRVLVTAATERALSVLRDKLPDEIKNLAVSLVDGKKDYKKSSGGSVPKNDLEASVSSIIDEINRGEKSSYHNRIASLEEQWSKSQEAQALLKNELITTKEKNSRHQLININYRGTLIEIANKLIEDKQKYEWFDDNYANLIDEVNIEQKFEEYLQLHDQFKNFDVSQLEYKLPVITSLTSVEELTDYKLFCQRIAEYQIDINPFDSLIKLDIQTIKVLVDKLRELYNSDILKNNPIGKEFIGKFLDGEIDQCRQRVLLSKEILERSIPEQLKVIDREFEIVYDTTNSLKQLRNDARILLDYVLKGNNFNSLSFVLKKNFIDTEIKGRLYFLEKVRINGSGCKTKEDFEIIIKDLNLKQDYNELEAHWNIKPLRNNSYYNKYLYFHKLVSDGEQCLKLIENVKDTNLELEGITKSAFPLFNSKILEELSQLCGYNFLLHEIRPFKESYLRSCSYLDSEYFHPDSILLSKALKKLDVITYENELKRLDFLVTERRSYEHYLNCEKSLRNQFPKLMGDVGKVRKYKSEVSNAILYNHASEITRRFLSKDFEEKLLSEIENEERKEKKIIAELAAQKSWLAVIERLEGNRSLLQSLQAWVLAVGKIGVTGKGPRAMKFRREAQRQMENCKDSIPCWIMPLIKVTETVVPDKEIFDYVIIDEASQLGPDALFLFYIAKNVIIVGDDKQTSPEYVGLSSNQLTPFIQKFLGEIPHRNFYGTEFSLFDHTKIYLQGLVVLREHFRCMPEIIDFSNKEFYAPTGKGLYPLKQYSEKRLEPLVAVFCPQGHAEGSGGNIRNEPEAKCIVETVKQLIKDPRYENKSIAIIVLQGAHQVNLIKQLLSEDEEIDKRELDRRGLIVGTSSDFQGDERDVILLSLVTASDHRRTSLTTNEDQRRYNVAASRAKEQMWLFHSVHLSVLNQHDLRYKLLYHFLHGVQKPLILTNRIARTFGSQPAPFDSWFEVDVYNEIVMKGYSVIPQYEVAKGMYRIDLVVICPNGTKIAIECDGDFWHGPEQYWNDRIRQKTLERCGWQFVRIRGYEFYLDKEQALGSLWQVLERNHNGTKQLSISGQIGESLIPIENIKDEARTTEKESTTSLVEIFEDGIEDDLVLRFLNINLIGRYHCSSSRDPESDFSLPIRKSHSNGFLLQCYSNGHINKIKVSTLLSKKMDKEYMNGLNPNGIISSLFFIEEDQLLGIKYSENNEVKFKAHYTSEITDRELLYLQGYKVIYSEFEAIEYHPLPLKAKDEIFKLIYKSFTASGKSIANNYYSSEWEKLSKYIPNFFN